MSAKRLLLGDENNTGAKALLEMGRGLDRVFWCVFFFFINFFSYLGTFFKTLCFEVGGAEDGKKLSPI